jgi:hypothetical protein
MLLPLRADRATINPVAAGLPLAARDGFGSKPHFSAAPGFVTFRHGLDLATRSPRISTSLQPKEPPLAKMDFKNPDSSTFVKEQDQHPTYSWAVRTWVPPMTLKEVKNE